MNKTIYIHIGTHNAGTKIIQHFLNANRGRLMELGYDYPDVGIGEGGHQRLSAELVRQHELSIFKKGTKVLNYEIGKFARWSKLKKHIVASNSSKIVLSSDEFEWLSVPEAIPALLGQNDYEIVVYLRRQDVYLESLYQLFVTNNQRRMKTTIERWSERVLSRLQYHDYLRLIERWGAIFGKEKISVAVFEDELEKGLEKGFLGRIGIQSFEEGNFDTLNEDLFLAQGQMLDSRCLEFLRLCNTKSFSGEKRNAILSALLNVSREFKEQGIFSKALFTQKRRREVLDSVANSNNKLREQYLPHKAKLFPDIESKPTEVKKALKRVVPLFMSYYESD